VKIVGTDAPEVERALRSGGLACPSCAGRLPPSRCGLTRPHSTTATLSERAKDGSAWEGPPMDQARCIIVVTTGSA